jgi:hypothetical protein
MSAHMLATRFPTARLIEFPPQALDAVAISQKHGTHEGKTAFAPRDNQSLGTKHEGQSEIR